MDCEYVKYGCNIRLSNSDHAVAHSHHQVQTHLKLLSSALDAEVNENKTLNQKIVQMGKTIKEFETKFSDYDSKFKELESRISENGKTPSQTPSVVTSSSAAASIKSPTYGSASKEASKEQLGTKEALRPSYTPSPAKFSPPVTDNKPRTSLSSHSASSYQSKYSSSTPAAPPAAVAEKSLEISGGFEKGILWSYSCENDDWSRTSLMFKMEKTAFAEGALRAAHRVEIKNVIGPADAPPDPAISADKTVKSGLPIGLNLFGDKYVSKLSMKPVPAERYFIDVKMQAICAELGSKFNQKGMPKPIQFLPAWVLEFPKSNHYCGLEPFIEGDFIKQSNNTGLVFSDRNTPQAFSHFTWEASNHSMLVVDLQGVKDFYTDPQIHTKDGKGFGLGNLGMGGVERFLKNHKCNAICQMLNLPLLNLPETNKKKLSLMKGTQKVPYIEDALGVDSTIKWEGPTNFSKGEFQCIQTISGHEDQVMSLCVAGKYLFSGQADGAIKAWNLNTYTLETTINAHRRSVESMCSNGVNLYSGSADHSIKVWDLNLNNLEAVAQLRDHVGEVNCIVLSDKALGYLVSGSFDKNIKVWSVRTNKCVQNLEGHSKAIKSLAISGTILFSGSNDGRVMIWNRSRFYYQMGRTNEL